MEFNEYDTRVGIYGIATREGEHGTEVLLALWNAPDYPRWTMPGGGMDWGENFVDALTREFYEETGLQIEVGDLVKVDQAYFTVEDLGDRDRPMRSLRIIHQVTVTGGTLGTTEVDGSTIEARWFPLADVPTLPHVPLVDAALGLRPQFGS